MEMRNTLKHAVVSTPAGTVLSVMGVPATAQQTIQLPGHA